MTPESVLARVDKTLPGLNNFYMAGQWVEPGNGIAAALYSGRYRNISLAGVPVEDVGDALYLPIAALLPWRA